MRTIALETADGREVAREVRIADSFIARSVGLLRDEVLNEHQGLLLIPGASIHTLGMRFPVDLVFLDRRMRILNFSPNVAPWRFRIAPPGTRRVLELSAGRIAAVKLLIGTFVVVAHEARADEEAAATRPLRSHAPPPPMCTRTPIQFSLRLPPQHRGTVRSNLGCCAGRAGTQTSNSDAAT